MRDVIVGVFYRPPDQKLEGDLEMRRQIMEVSKTDTIGIKGTSIIPKLTGPMRAPGKKEKLGFSTC